MQIAIRSKGEPLTPEEKARLEEKFMSIEKLLGRDGAAALL